MDTDNDGVISKQEFDASGSVADVEFDDFVIQDADDIANWIWLVCKHTPSNPICTEPNKAAVNIFDVEKFEEYEAVDCKDGLIKTTSDNWESTYCINWKENDRCSVPE